MSGARGAPFAAVRHSCVGALLGARRLTETTSGGAFLDERVDAPRARFFFLGAGDPIEDRASVAFLWNPTQSSSFES